MKLGKSQREKEVKRVASVAAFNADGLLLFGKRSDSGKWTLPGGHLEPGEEPMDGAKRELEEEASLKGQTFEFLGRGMGGPKNDIIIYSYRCVVDGTPDGVADPDEECDEWRWVEPDDIPTEIMDNLHAPKNVTLRLLGLQDGEVEEPMQKKADPYFIETRTYSGRPLKIPKFRTKSRREWDNQFLRDLTTQFANGDSTRFRHLGAISTENLGGVNMAVNKSRLRLYQRMLKAKDRLPPVLVKRVGMGYHLLDGNHRLEATKSVGHSLINAIELLDPPLKKGLPGVLLAGALMGGAMKPAPAPKPQPVHELAQELGAPAWHPEGLHPDMHPIAHLESSFGQNLAHASHSKGAFHTAFGAVGFKPVTAHEEYTKSKFMQGLYPGFHNPEDFVKTFQSDPKFYNLLASAHFERLKRRHGNDVQRAAFAWRWGTGACSKATDEQVKNDAYVQKYTHMALHAKQGQPTIKKSEQHEHDPLAAMLHHDDPRERVMALRSKHVTPYHLRVALQDEDPDVREAAAKHPMMTSALIEEALRHHDLHTKEAALSRPDLLEHHLEIALWDPDLQTQASRHPALTEEQRHKLIGATDTPEGLRTELLSKSIGYLKYPKLGGTVPTGPMIRTPEAHAEMTIRSTIGKPTLSMATSKGVTRYNTRRDSPVPEHKRYLSMSVRTGDGLQGLIGHETQHGVFARLKQMYGKEAGYRIVASTLSALDQKDHQHLRNLTDWSIKNKYDPIQEPEERIAHLQNYLQDGLWRKSAHKAMRIHMDPNAEKISHDWAKAIWQKLRLRSESIGPEHVGVIRKDDIEAWVARKSESGIEYNVYEDMLGLTPKTDSYLEAAKFLGRSPDKAAFRQALLADYDLVDSALISIGLDLTPQNRAAILSVIKLQSNLPLKKANKTHEITALMADGTEVAEGVRRGYGADTQQELHLGGKHSKGSMMVRDPETGQIYLLKPGSGGQSPARGAQEEHANQSRREAAFWHVAEAWGLNQRVPRADLLLIDGQEVAALHMLPFDWSNLEKLKFKDAGLPHKALEKYRQNGELHKWAILDFVLGNPDRHGQNLMVGPQKEGYPVALIDHGSAFAGNDFDPAHDKNSFIPYYLRAWKAEGWGKLTPDQKLRAMPAVSGDTERQLREWFHGINAADMEAVLHRFGIDPVPSVARLAKVKALLAEENFSVAVNGLWLAT